MMRDNIELIRMKDLPDFVLKASLMFVVVCTSIFVIHGSQTTYAAATYNTGGIPSGMVSALQKCDGSSNEAAQGAWVSPVGNPTAQTATIPYGGTSVTLQYNAVVYVCSPNGLDSSGNVATSRVGTNYKIISTNPDVPNFDGRTVLVPFGRSNGNQRFYVKSVNFTYTFPSAQTSDSLINFSAHWKAINNKGSNSKPTPECVTNSGTTNNWTPASMSDFGACNSIGSSQLVLAVHVLPAPYNGKCVVHLPDAVMPGQTFTAWFSAKNTGSNWWPVDPSVSQRVKLGTVGDVAPFGVSGNSNRVDIYNSNPQQGNGYTPGWDYLWWVASGQTASFNTYPMTFTAPSAVGDYSQSWRILQERVRAQIGKSCSGTLHVSTTNPSTCTVSVDPTTVRGGGTFKATFKVTNNSGTDWQLWNAPVFSLKNNDTSNPILWGKSSEAISHSGDGTTGLPALVVAANGGTATWTDTFTAPNVAGPYAFSWQIQSGSIPLNPPANCLDSMHTIPIVTVVNNSPYVRARDNDVWAGALFSNNTGTCSYDSGDSNTTTFINNAQSAKITTNNLINVDDNTENYLLVARLYQAMLGRAGEPTGISGWVAKLNSGESLSGVITDISDTSEYTSTGLGRHPTSNSDNDLARAANAAFITQLYSNAFGRSPESTGVVNGWANRMIGNGAWTPQDVIKYFVKSSDSSTFSFDGNTSSYGGSGTNYGVFTTGGIDFGDSLGFTGRNGSTRDLRSVSGEDSARFDLVFPNTADPPSDSIPPLEYDSFTGTPLCLPDYYSQYSQLGGAASGIPTLAANQSYIINYNSNSLGPLTIPSGADVTIVSSANPLTISGNITYADKGTLEHPTSFKLIVSGNLNVTSDVTRLDGSYIVQPQVTTGGSAKIILNTGILNTCSDIETSPAPTTSSKCAVKLGAANKLTINGQVIAQDIKLNRLYGSIGYSNGPDGTTPTDAATDTCLPLKNYNMDNAAGYAYMYGANGSGGGTVDNCAAELFDFDPAQYLVGASSGGSSGAPQSLQELPPIY